VTDRRLGVALRNAPSELRGRATARVLRARRRTPFVFDGHPCRYLVHHHNATWTNERTVEVPIAARVIERHPGGRMLEVGNVLHNYLPRGYVPTQREVVDKHERAPGVTNVDVLAFSPAVRYDIIVSISTMEHVGWDEEPRDGALAAAAIACLHTWLAPGGELLVTVPLGYHAELDRQLLDGEPLFEQLRFMRRVDAANSWAQADADEVRGARYGSPFPYANAIAVGRSSG
jgi:hypothetical protein